LSKGNFGSPIISAVITNKNKIFWRLSKSFDVSTVLNCDFKSFVNIAMDRKYDNLRKIVVYEGEKLVSPNDVTTGFWAIDNNCPVLLPFLKQDNESITDIVVHNEFCCASFIDKSIRIWNMKENKQLGKIREVHNGQINCLTISENFVFFAGY
jgi:WD40 repeat protein